mmetsp:Transcript_86707/g.231460  ORF Transcript_86707/g.231460 Transcript_86707/m.231460 type:complete len:116 (-) Transcript_86707:68-415(-)
MNGKLRGKVHCDCENVDDCRGDAQYLRKIFYSPFFMVAVFSFLIAELIQTRRIRRRVGTGNGVRDCRCICVQYLDVNPWASFSSAPTDCICLGIRRALLLWRISFATAAMRSYSK